MVLEWRTYWTHRLQVSETGWTISSLDDIFSDVNSGQSVEIPTTVGFCMYIKRSCIDAVGLFDENTFGRGYGEECDFCLRASQKGWGHVLCADTFVYHAGGVGFGSLSLGRRVVNERVRA